MKKQKHILVVCLTAIVGGILWKQYPTSSAYVAEFKSIYSDGLKTQNIREAVATFERSVITPNSRFDRYLRGENETLTLEDAVNTMAVYQLARTLTPEDTRDIVHFLKTLTGERKT